MITYFVGAIVMAAILFLLCLCSGKLIENDYRKYAVACCIIGLGWPILLFAAVSTYLLLFLASFVDKVSTSPKKGKAANGD